VVITTSGCLLLAAALAAVFSEEGRGNADAFGRDSMGVAVAVVMMGREDRRIEWAAAIVWVDCGQMTPC
jgi:hypothetical protein